MGGETERGQVIVEMIVVAAMIGAIFIFIFDRGILARSELAKTRFQAPAQRQLNLQSFDYLEDGVLETKTNYRKRK